MIVSHTSRRRGVSFLESRIPVSVPLFLILASCFLPIATAATVIGPAKGPRPTSSMPIIHLVLTINIVLHKIWPMWIIMETLVDSVLAVC